VVIAHFGGGIAAVKDRLLAKGYRFGTLNAHSRITLKCFTSISPDLKRSAGFALCASGIRAELFVFASDYPQDFTGVNTYTGRDAGIKKLHRYDP
jgi:hypothetical protein